jgi:hypothetical protein
MNYFSLFQDYIMFNNDTLIENQKSENQYVPHKHRSNRN